MDLKTWSFEMTERYFHVLYLSAFVLQVAEVTFNYWYKLSEDLYNKDSTQLNEVYKPFIQRLIVALCQHCQMDPDHVSSTATSIA